MAASQWLQTRGIPAPQTPPEVGVGVPAPRTPDDQQLWPFCVLQIQGSNTGYRGRSQYTSALACYHYPVFQLKLSRTLIALWLGCFMLGFVSIRKRVSD